VKAELLLIGCLSVLGCSRNIGEREYAGNLNDTYLVITLPKVSDPTNCFPQGYVSVNRIGNKLSLDDVEGQTNRKPWISENMVGFTYNMKNGYCNVDGEIVIDPIYDGSIRPFCNDLAVVMMNGKYFYIDTSGKTVAGPFDWAYDFSKNVGSVKVNGLWGFINSKGAWAVRSKFSRLDLCVGGYSAKMPDGESGFVDENGEFIETGELGSYYHPVK
jgi:hypothetical protein